MRASDDVTYLSAKLVGGDAVGKVGTWARVKFNPDASGLLWGVNGPARKYTVWGADVPRTRVDELADADHPAARKSRACARRGTPS